MKINMSIEQLKVAYAQEQKEQRPPLNRNDLPLSYESITPQWLTSALCDKHPGAIVTACRLDAPDDGNTNRRRIFLEYNEVGVTAKLPNSLFCKATHGLENRMSVGLNGCAASEVDFYNKIRPQLSLEAPVGYFSNFDYTTLNSIVMLGDLGHNTTFCNHTTEITRSRVEDQLRLLATFHGKFLESPELHTTLNIFPTWVDFFDVFDHFLKDACDIGFERSESVMPARLFTRRKEIWPATMQSAYAHNDMPHTLTHGDVHLRNWYITHDGKMGLNDWQSSTRGHWSRDLAYTIVTALNVENRRDWEQELLTYYIEQLSEVAGKPIAFDGVFDAYRQQLLSILAFWTITINPAEGMPDMQPEDSTLEFIKRITTAIDDLDALDSFNL